MQLGVASPGPVETGSRPSRLGAAGGGKRLALQRTTRVYRYRQVW